MSKNVAKRLAGKKRKPSTKVPTMGLVQDTLRINRPIVPDSTVVDLKWVDPTTTYTNNGSIFWSKRYHMNGAADPDPAIFTVIPAGFSEWAKFYLRYRVLVFKYDVELSNINQNLGMIFTVAPSKLDPGINNPAIFESITNPYAQQQLVSVAGGQDRVRFRGSLDMASYSGYQGYLTDDVTGALVSTVPAALWYFSVGAKASSSMGPNPSIINRSLFTFVIQFYERAYETQT
jgi:hypothetical protein